MATMSNPKHFMQTSGEQEPVWIHTEPYKNRPKYEKLAQDLETDVCIIGAGIAGISAAFELVKEGKNVVLIEARDVLSGETGRTSGHLSTSLGDGFTEIASKHGEEHAKLVAQSHAWALEHVGKVSKQLGIECEYRTLPAYQISKYTHGSKEHKDDTGEIAEEMEKAAKLGLKARYDEKLAIKGWDGKIDQRGAGVFEKQATFHPTKYLVGLLKWLNEQSNFSCYTNTRAQGVEEKGIELLGMGSKVVKITTEAGNTITCKDALETTNVPLQKLSVVAQMEFMRTYCIAMRIPKNSYKDCLIYDSEEPYKYIRYTECDEKDDYIIVGGCDHKVGQEAADGRFEELESWTRDRFTQVGATDYKWSGQVFNAVDYIAFIGANQGQSHIYVATGDTGNGLTHGTIAGKLIANEILGKDNPWAAVYNPSRKSSILQKLPSMIANDVQINTQYKRFLQSDITDIEDLAPGEGGILNPKLSKPIAVYKDDSGKVHQYSAVCPHMKACVVWNKLEKSWDCPVHASRFSKDGVCVMGPAKGNLVPEDDNGKMAQQQALEG